MPVCRIMIGSGTKRFVVALAAVCLTVGVTGCARWPGGRPARAPLPAYTSFDDLLPSNVTSIVYLPDLPKAKERFRATDLAKRLENQTGRGLWRHIDFLRPWVGVAFEQISEQVDEIAWGTYRIADGRENWFLVARLHLPVRRVLERLHEKTLPRVAEDLRPLEMTHSRYRGRRVYEWVHHEGAEARRLVCYALIGQVMVMGSDAAYVDGAIERRPTWFRQWFSGRRESAMDRSEALQVAFADFERSDDLFAWFRVQSGVAESVEPPASRFGRVAARLRQIVASNLDAAGVGFRITAPTIMGRWRLHLARPGREEAAARKPFDFVTLVPASARTLIALHNLSLDHPLFGEIRALLGKAMALEPFEQLRNWFRVFGLVPGIGDVPRILTSLEGKVAYCSFQTAETSRTERCLMVALENPAAVALGLGALPLLLRGVAEKEEYRGRMLLRLREKIAVSQIEIVFAVVGSALVVSHRADTVHHMVNAIEQGETLDRQEVVKQLLRYRTESILAEFYSTRNAREPLDTETNGAASVGASNAAPQFLRDPRLNELASGQSYSICLQRPRGVEIVTCSATGFHWSSATWGLAAIVMRATWIADLMRSDVGR